MNKLIRHLTIDECAILAGLLKQDLAKLGEEQEYWKKTPDFEHIAKALSKRKEDVKGLLKPITRFLREQNHPSYTANSNSAIGKANGIVKTPNSGAKD